DLDDQLDLLAPAYGEDATQRDTALTAARHPGAHVQPADQAAVVDPDPARPDGVHDRGVGERLGAHVRTAVVAGPEVGVGQGDGAAAVDRVVVVAAGGEVGVRPAGGVVAVHVVGVG